jgi:hypothetical protein
MAQTIDQKRIDEARSLGRQDIVVDEVGETADVSRLMTDRGGEDRRRKMPMP